MKASTSINSFYKTLINTREFFMARKKVKLSWIANDSTRRATLRKRRNGLLKKASELSILCNVKVCAVIYDPGKPKPEVWPSESEATKVLQDFKAMPEYDQGTRRVDQEGFLRQRNAKLHQQLLRQQVQNKQLEMKALMVQGIAGARRLSDVSFEDAAILRLMIGGTEKDVRLRIEASKAQKARAETEEGVKNERLMDGANEADLNLTMNASKPPNAQIVPGNSSGGGLENVMPPNVMNDRSDPWIYPTVWMQPYTLNNWMDPSVFPFGHL